MMIDGVNKAKYYYEQGKAKVTGNHRSPGRPNGLNLNDETAIVQHILQCQNANIPLSPEWLEFVNDKYNLNYSQSWPFSFIKKWEEELIIVDAYPLEEARAELTMDQLKEHEKLMTELWLKYNQDLICNWDQTASEVIKYSKKSVIVGKNIMKKKIYYKTITPTGHITLMPVIFPDGSCIKPLIIISQKTIDSDLERYGLPNGNTGYVLSTTTGFTTADAHLDYCKNVVIPYFTNRRRNLGLPGNERALVIQDGLVAHVDKAVNKLLKENNIDTAEFPAHSSHICQPLDVVTFPMFKREMKKIVKSPKYLCERSQRIYKILCCIERCTGPLINNSAFESAGFIYHMSQQKKMEFDLCKITKNDLSPNDPVNANDVQLNKLKMKRIKLKRKKTKKEKKINPDFVIQKLDGLKMTLIKQ